MNSGFCACGCGQRTKLARYDDKIHGIKQGEPRKFVHGHQSRLAIGPHRWTVEDRGYETPCWIWQGSRGTEKWRSYGRIKRDGRHLNAHRFVYEQLRGPVDPNLVLDHLCCETYCVNPDHLEPVTVLENFRRGKERAAQRRASA